MRTRSKTGFVCPRVQPTLLGPWLLMLGQMDSPRPGRYTRRLKKGRKDCKPFIFVDTIIITIIIVYIYYYYYYIYYY
jgi:hypothetical protein